MIGHSQARCLRIKETVYHIEAPLQLTIALLSDTHNTEPTAILNSLRSHQPDLICIAGDVLLGHRPKDDNLIVRSQENVLKLVSGCVGIAPTYLSLGNHEWMVCIEDLEILTSTGAVVLDNGYVEVAGGKIVIGGLTSAIVSYFQKIREQGVEEIGAEDRAKDGEQDGAEDRAENGVKNRTESGAEDRAQDRVEERYPQRPNHFHPERLNTESAWLDEFEKQEGYKILLCHHPEYWSLREPYLINRHIDLILSGHAHGGQMRIMGRGLFAPGQGWLPKYTSGVYQGEYGSLVVSRGLSNTASPVPRLGNPTEVVYVELGE